MAHGYLSYQDNRGEGSFLGDVVKAVKNYLDNREKKEKVADMVAAKVIELNDQKALPQGQTPLLKGGNEKQIAGTPLQKMLGGTALQRTLPGAVATQPDVVGGPLAKAGFTGRPLKPEGFASDQIVDIGATNLGVERDLGGSDMFVKTLSDVSGDSGAVVQAIDRLTMVTMSLVSATQEQTNSQKQIAAAQQQHSDKLARKSIAAAEESSLEQGGDLSGNSAYLALAGQQMMGGRGGPGGGPGMGIGGKVLAKKLLGSATKRGAARTGTRLGAALGGKMLGGFGKKMGARLGAKGIGKIAGGAVAKSLGKKIPLVGLGLGAVFAAQRAMKGDFLGAGLELASGAASTVPGLGTAGSIGIDAALAARDMTAMAEGGITDGPVNALIGEAGREGVFPLEGSEGKKTFIKFGEGIFEAQKRNKKDFAKLQAEGLTEYYDKRNGWKKFVEGIVEFFKEVFGNVKVFGKKLFNFDKDKDKDKDDDKDKKNRDPVGTTERMLPGNYDFGHDLPATNTVSGQNYGASRDGGTRKHAGTDFDISGADETFSSQIGGEVIYAGNAGGGYGNVVDIYNEKLGVTERIAEAAEILPGIKVGDKIEPGTPVVRGENTDLGGVIHYEIREGRADNSGSFEGTKDPMKFLKEHTAHTDGVPKNKPPTTTGSSTDDSTSTGTGKDTEPEPKGDWAKAITPFGDDSYIDFGPDNKYRAIQQGNGYSIHKFGGFGFLQRVDTTDGKNIWLKDALMEAGAAKLEAAKPDTSETLTSSLSPADDSSTELNNKSTEVALADTSTVASTTIINNYNGGSGDGSSTVGNQVDFAPTNADLGGDVYSNTRIRTLVG
tara:strand:+ start:56 stop:2554 length:2499 start_codon:yes stop_codon:yes gene_type:complete